jgi:hypothetical protein
VLPPALATTRRAVRDNPRGHGASRPAADEVGRPGVPSKLNVAGSNPVARSKKSPAIGTRSGGFPVILVGSGTFGGRVPEGQHA